MCPSVNKEEWTEAEDLKLVEIVSPLGLGLGLGVRI